MDTRAPDEDRPLRPDEIQSFATSLYSELATHGDFERLAAIQEDPAQMVKLLELAPGTLAAEADSVRRAILRALDTLEPKLYPRPAIILLGILRLSQLALSYARQNLGSVIEPGLLAKPKPLVGPDGKTIH